MTNAFVFGGAGTRGDFQVGAAHLLYDRGIAPQVITGTSGGAIVALKLAEGGVGAVVEAENLLRGLANASAIYRRQDWLVEVADRADFAQRVAAWVEVNSIGLAAVGLASLPLVVEPGFLAATTVVAGSAALALQHLLAQGLAANGLFDATPLRRLLAQNVDRAKVASSGIRLRLGVVGIETANLRFVTETGQFVDLASVGPQDECDRLRLMLTSARAEFERLDAEVQNYVSFPDDSGRPDPDYRALVAQRNKAGENVRKILASQKDAGCPVDAQIDLCDAAVASGAMPGYFPPVNIAGELYVDGGIRSLLPVRAAVEAGADRVYAIYPKSDLTFEPIAGQARIAQYLGRAIDLMLEEIRTLETAAVGSDAEVTLIQPTSGVTIHGELAIEPGRTSISIGYGYMRASDVIDGAVLSPADRKTLHVLSDLITRSRLACWNLEQFVFGFETRTADLLESPDTRPVSRPSDLGFVDAVRVRKWVIGHLVRCRLAIGGAVPADARAWTLSWELHDWTPMFVGPWDKMALGSKAVEVADPATYGDTGVWVREASGSETFVIIGSRRHTTAGVPPGQAVHFVEDGCLAFFEPAGPLPPRPDPGPDPCAIIAEEDRDLAAQLVLLTEELATLDPRTDKVARKQVRDAIAAVDARREQLQSRSTQLGC